MRICHFSLFNIILNVLLVDETSNLKVPHWALGNQLHINVDHKKKLFFCLGYWNITITADHFSICFILSGERSHQQPVDQQQPISPMLTSPPPPITVSSRYIAIHVQANESQSCYAGDTLPLVRCQFSSSQSNNSAIITKW